MTDSKTYFVMSDVHSFFSAMKQALDMAKFDLNNKNHILIFCGDMFDRGDETLQTYEFIRSIPRDRRILIRGNHEYLLQDCLRRERFTSYDKSNGTEKTVMAFAGVDRSSLYSDTKIETVSFSSKEEVEKYQMLWAKQHEDFRKKLFTDNKKAHKVVDWIFSDEWVNYYELGKYVFVHSWVPLVNKSMQDLYYTPSSFLRYRADWRDATPEEWEEATWGCPWRNVAEGGLTPPRKTIVCGHWATYDFHKYLGHETVLNRDIYYSKQCVALDATTALEPHICNVLVIKNGLCYDTKGSQLYDNKEVPLKKYDL